MSEKSNKTPYVKPCVEKIDLSADEVLSAGCKTDSGAGGVTEAPQPVNGCAINGCVSEIGS